MDKLKELLKELGATDAQIDKAEGIVNESTQAAIDAEVAGLKKKNKELLEKYKNPDDDARQKLIMLESASPKEQAEILGPTRAKLYQQGMPVESFVKDGKLLTLKELK